MASFFIIVNLEVISEPLKHHGVRGCITLPHVSDTCLVNLKVLCSLIFLPHSVLLASEVALLYFYVTALVVTVTHFLFLIFQTQWLSEKKKSRLTDRPQCGSGMAVFMNLEEDTHFYFFFFFSNRNNVFVALDMK